MPEVIARVVSPSRPECSAGRVHRASKEVELLPTTTGCPTGILKRSSCSTIGTEWLDSSSLAARILPASKPCPSVRMCSTSISWGIRPTGKPSVVSWCRVSIRPSTAGLSLVTTPLDGIEIGCAEEVYMGESPSIRDDSNEPQVTGVKRGDEFCECSLFSLLILPLDELSIASSPPRATPCRRPGRRHPVLLSVASSIGRPVVSHAPVPQLRWAEEIPGHPTRKPDRWAASCGEECSPPCAGDCGLRKGYG
jgi:hypothetical protein